MGHEIVDSSRIVKTDTLGLPSFSPAATSSIETIPLSSPIPIGAMDTFGIDNILWGMNTFDLSFLYTQAQLQCMLFTLLNQISINPNIDHTIPDAIKNNYNPNRNYTQYGSNGDKISKLTPEMQDKTMQLIDYAKSMGMEVTITSGYRTEAEQAELRRRKPNLAAKKSLHCQGKAIDIKIKNGTDADYKKLGQFAKSIGMRWGGDFKNPCAERWHFDLGWS